MKHWLLALTVLTFSSASFAQKIKVRRVKGNQAVIEFSGGSLQSGQVYELAPDEFADSSVSTTSRKYVIALSASLMNTKSDAAGAQNETDLSLTGKFGWNFGSYEFGPLLTYASDQVGSITTTSYKVGGFADYNLISNTPGEAFLYGIGGTASIGQIDGGSGSKRDLMDFFVGPFVKWFPTGSNVGFRLDVGYIYQKQSGGVGSEATISGLASAVGILAYF
ncbi:hypothetical protein [Bdellovibrio sp. HCB-162]|uniref:hypothetical protein n=1 Tax=Bdellovibrio sp. HCB-162 TaxID=3394234 RepID=UPI0039BC527D